MHRVISLFSGSGGLDQGFLQTGKFRVVLANDINPHACASYRRNLGDHIVCQDIRTLVDLPPADVLIGGPPCQGFSTANPARAFDDERNWLFKEYQRILGQVRPKLFVMENVSGMRTLEGGKVFAMILAELAVAGPGYAISTRLLNAVDYGAPQVRRRVIIVGVRLDLATGARGSGAESERLDADAGSLRAEPGSIRAEFGPACAEFEFPKPTHGPAGRGPGADQPRLLPYGTFRDACSAPIPPGDPNHRPAKLTALNAERLRHIPPGGSMKDCPAELHNNSDLKRAMRRLSLDQPAYTIVHNNCDHYYHPTEHRRITIREMARLQGYPDSYVFCGSKSEQSRQVGNSVPVALARALGEAVAEFLKRANRGSVPR
jgi:DNA (cytosine-5)-methyltransferase 1